MSEPWITDCRELLDLRNGGQEIPERSQDLAHRFGLIVSMASARRDPETRSTPMSCPCNDGSGTCTGPLVVGREASGEIRWSCEGCGSTGRIVHWSKTPWDLSPLVAVRKGRPRRRVQLTRMEFAALEGLAMVEEGAELALRAAVLEKSNIVLSAITDDLAELILAAETAIGGACPCEARALRSAAAKLATARSGRKSS